MSISVLNLKYAGELSINNWTGLLVFYFCSRKNKLKKNNETDRTKLTLNKKLLILT